PRPTAARDRRRAAHGIRPGISGATAAAATKVRVARADPAGPGAPQGGFDATRAPSMGMPAPAGRADPERPEEPALLRDRAAIVGKSAHPGRVTADVTRVSAPAAERAGISPIAAMGPEDRVVLVERAVRPGSSAGPGFRADRAAPGDPAETRDRADFPADCGISKGSRARVSRPLRRSSPIFP